MSYKFSSIIRKTSVWFGILGKSHIGKLFRDVLTGLSINSDDLWQVGEGIYHCQGQDLIGFLLCSGIQLNLPWSYKIDSNLVPRASTSNLGRQMAISLAYWFELLTSRWTIMDGFFCSGSQVADMESCAYSCCKPFNSCMSKFHMVPLHYILNQGVRDHYLLSVSVFRIFMEGYHILLLY